MKKITSILFTALFFLSLCLPGIIYAFGGDTKQCDVEIIDDTGKINTDFDNEINDFISDAQPLNESAINITNFVKSNMSYSYSKTSSKQRRANINSLSDIYKNEGELVAVAIRRRGGICYNYAALAKALYDRRGGHDMYFVYGSGKYGVHCWVADKTENGIRYTDVKRRAYFYTAAQMKSHSNTSDLRWSFSESRPY